MTLPTCAKCGSLSVADICATCGAKRTTAPAAATEMSSVSVPGLQLDGISAPQAADTTVLPERKHRQAGAYLSLQPSEEAVLHAASRIFAAMIANGEVDQGNEATQSDRAVKLATRMALVIEKYIQSDNEDW